MCYAFAALYSSLTLYRSVYSFFRVLSGRCNRVLATFTGASCDTLPNFSPRRFRSLTRTYLLSGAENGTFSMSS